MTLHLAATLGAIGYCAVFGAGFVFRPALAGRLGLVWTDPAGKTEVRAYYGALSWALAVFLGYLAVNDLVLEALTGVLLFATAVLLSRVIGTFVDRGWAEAYNRQAIPIEAAFVFGLFACRALD